MPEKGWAILTVRIATAMKVKELARRRGMTVDEYINALIKSPTGAPHGVDWTTCNICGAKVKSVNLPTHKARVHPSTRLTSQQPANKP